MQAQALKRDPEGLEAPLQVIGKYALFAPFATGGMATVHLGRLLGDAGFARTVAIKRLAEHVASEQPFVAMLLDEARLASRFRHANVAATMDVVSAGRELWLVMEYVHGESLRELLGASAVLGGMVLGGMDSRVVGSIAVGALHGLHAAHEARSESGELLGVVHRDVSPQNILVGKDGIARVVDFGVAKAAGRLQQTNVGQFKGKPRYMAPEALRVNASAPIDRRTDIFGMGAVLWEALTGRPLFDDESRVDVLMQVLTKPIPPPETIRPSVPASVGAVVMRALRRDPAERYATAEEFAIALEEAFPTGLASQHAVGSLVQRLAGQKLAQRERMLGVIERNLPSDEGGAKRVLAKTAPRPEAHRNDDALDAPTIRQKRDEILASEIDVDVDTDTDADALDAPTLARAPTFDPATTPVPAPPAQMLRTEKIQLRDERPVFVSDGNTVKMRREAPPGERPLGESWPGEPRRIVPRDPAQDSPFMVTAVRMRPTAPSPWFLVLALVGLAVAAAAAYIVISAS